MHSQHIRNDSHLSLRSPSAIRIACLAGTSEWPDSDCSGKPHHGVGSSGYGRRHSQELDDQNGCSDLWGAENIPRPLCRCTCGVSSYHRHFTHASDYADAANTAKIAFIDASDSSDGSIKGFAMVRFSNPQESAAAVAVEKSRRTQIEFAKSDRK